MELTLNWTSAQAVHTASRGISLSHLVTRRKGFFISEASRSGKWMHAPDSRILPSSLIAGMHRLLSSGKLRPENCNPERFVNSPLSPTDTNVASARSPIVSINNLIKQFGRFAALRSVSADFAPGRLYAILGDNGAGKTTLLRVLAGLTQPTQGEISVLGVRDIRSVCGKIGYMAHPSLLYDEMSGIENLRYFARLYGIEDDQRCARVIIAVKLDPALERPVGQYSQGMRQRMSLARALLNDPTLLLLDEPFSNVDVRSAREMVSLLGQMRDAGKTIFVVTHQAALLAGAADEFVRMDAGRIASRVPDLLPEEAR
jgi:ABC-type multidrug transport system ATPase subunit